jgi:cytochrome oxidase Cu insertion factor (SCO1/SenC/PrrC family)
MTSFSFSCTYKKLTALVIFLSLLHTNSSYAAVLDSPEITPEELNFKTQVGLEDYENVEYRDTQGNRVNFVQFQSMLAQYNFSMEKRKSGGKGSAILQLTAKDAKPPAPKYKLQPGSAFPGFSLQSSNGTMVNNKSLLGRFTLVSFYFAECAPCVKEVPLLNSFAERHPDVATLAVTFDAAEEAKRFASRTKFSWRTVVNGKELIDKVGIQIYPAFLLLDTKGTVVAIGNQTEVGANDDALEQWVGRAMHGKGQAM